MVSAIVFCSVLFWNYLTLLNFLGSLCLLATPRDKPDNQELKAVRSHPPAPTPTRLLGGCGVLTLNKTVIANQTKDD